MIERLLETVYVKDGVPQNIIYHNQRFNRTKKRFWPDSQPIDLLEFIKVPVEHKYGAVKCRILYKEEIEEIQYLKYERKEINRIKVVEANFNYDFKWENRSAINELVESQPLYDDILMVKDGYITDTSYANIVLKKDNEFYTPKIPMLNGTKRQHLIDEDILIPRNIKPSDLKKFSHFTLINAFNDLDLTKFLPIKNILK
jgi:4-amino-4-deoxychorismate lyase